MESLAVQSMSAMHSCHDMDIGIVGEESIETGSKRPSVVGEHLDSDTLS
jgi:hypothetical protein